MKSPPCWLLLHNVFFVGRWAHHTRCRPRHRLGCAGRRAPTTGTMATALIRSPQATTADVGLTSWIPFLCCSDACSGSYLHHGFLILGGVPIHTLQICGGLPMHEFWRSWSNIRELGEPRRLSSMRLPIWPPAGTGSMVELSGSYHRPSRRELNLAATRDDEEVVLLIDFPCHRSRWWPLGIGSRRRDSVARTPLALSPSFCSLTSRAVGAGGGRLDLLAAARDDASCGDRLGRVNASVVFPLFLGTWGWELGRERSNGILNIVWEREKSFLT
jgi:hypothetical protein